VSRDNWKVYSKIYVVDIVDNDGRSSGWNTTRSSVHALLSRQFSSL